MDAEAIAAQEEADWAGLEDLDVDEYLLGIEGDDDGGAAGGGDSAANDDFGAGNQILALYDKVWRPKPKMKGKTDAQVWQHAHLFSHPQV